MVFKKVGTSRCNIAHDCARDFNIAISVLILRDQDDLLT